MKIQAFKVEKVMVDYTFAIKDQVITKNKTFGSIKQARKHLAENAREWFVGALEDWINHKRHIIEAAHPEQSKAFAQAWDLYLSFEKMDLGNMALKFLRNLSVFGSLLPSDKNKSYESSLHNLTQLREFCESITYSA